MRLLAKNTHFLLSGFFPKDTAAGFTTSATAGTDVAHDMSRVFKQEQSDISIAWCSQPHAEQISFVEHAGAFPSDGLLTAEKNMALVIRTADCLPLFFYESRNKYIGILHLGWRSLDKGILKTFSRFFKDKNCGKFTFAAGPGLRKCCYEVKKDFLRTSLRAIVEKRGKKLFFDPIRFVQLQLNSLCFDYEFLDTGICTFCTEKPLFSYRKNKTNKRTLSFIAKV